MAFENLGGLLEGISMVAHQASGNKVDNIMVVREHVYSIHWACAVVTIEYTPDSWLNK